MTVYDEVRHERDSFINDSRLKTMGSFVEEIKDPICFIFDNASRDSNRAHFIHIAALAIAAIEALDAEKGKEAGNVE